MTTLFMGFEISGTQRPSRQCLRPEIARLLAIVLLATTCGAETCVVREPDADEEWIALFDGRGLDGWYTYLSRHGRDNDPHQVFQVHDGVLHVYKDQDENSEPPLGYVSTVADYENYHLRFEYKWGTKRFGERRDSKRDSGLLYHTFGDDEVWPRSIELQIQEGDTGDIFTVGATGGVVPLRPKDSSLTYLARAAGGEPRFVGIPDGQERVVRAPMNEREGWNVCELIVRGGEEAVHIVNGKINNEISDLKFYDAPSQEWRPLTKGRIAFQAELAEVMYRNIKIKPLAPSRPATGPQGPKKAADAPETTSAPNDDDAAGGARELPEAFGRIGHIRVPEGFVIEQVAAPPLVSRPVSADFDEQGRLYVTESSGTNDDVLTQLDERPHRVVRLEDVDGDGTFDKRVVFADRMMLPEGALWHDGSLYVAAPPHIWKLTDIDEDGVADKREVWFDGKTLGGCANDTHGPYLGPDGWLYWCKGEFAEQTYERPGMPPLVTRAAHILRRRASGGPVEIVMTGGMNNPVDVVFTAGGERIFSTTFLQLPADGRRDGLIHAVYGGVYPRENNVLRGHPRTGELMPVLTHLGAAAPCGLVRLETDQLGDGFQECLLACQFNTHKVSRHRLTPREATFASQDHDFVTSDHPDFHPTDVLADADGSVLVVDTGNWYLLCCPTSRENKPESLGAIYRVRRVGAPGVNDPRGRSIDLARLDAQQLAALLGDPRPAVRSRAQGALVSRGEQAVPALTNTLGKDSSRDARLQAVWALTRIEGQTARRAVHAALEDSDEQVRQAAIHSVSVWRDATARDRLIALLRGASPHNRRAAAEAIGRIGDVDAVDDLLRAAGDYQGRVLEHSLVYALIEIGHADAIRTGLSADNPHARRAALLALENLEDGKLQADSVVGLLDADDSATAAAAWWIAQRHPQWAPAMVGYFREKLSRPELPAAELAALPQQLARFSASPEIQRLMASSLADSHLRKPAKLALLQGIGDSRIKKLPPAWRDELRKLCASDDPAIVAGAVMAIQSHLPSPLSDELREVAANRGLPAETRLRARACSLAGEPIDDEFMQLAIDELSDARPVPHRSLAVDVLLNAALSDDQLLLLAPKLRETASMDLARLLPAFAKSKSSRVGETLVEVLNDCPPADALDAEAVRRVLDEYGPQVAARAEPLLARIAAVAEFKAAQFDAVLRLLERGDARRGQEVFFDTKASCSACHAVGSRGGKVGPDLTNIGRIRDERSLLESILYPSASFVQNYEPIVITTVDGQIHGGVLKEETEEEVVLALDAEKVARIRSAEIDERAVGKVSIMPTGFDKQLTPQQLADLIVYLKSAGP